MTQPSKAIVVNILDKEYRIACPPEEEMALRNAAHYLDGQMRQIRQAGRVVGIDRVAVMAALNMAHELLVGRQGGAHMDLADFDDRLQLLNSKLDEALSPVEQR